MKKVEWVLKNVFTNERVPINSAVFTIGRDKMHNIVCKHTIISREHAKIFTLANNKLQIVNYSSTNATYVNNVPIQSNDELHENDEIGFGVCRAESMYKKVQAPYFIYTLEKVPDETDVIVIDDDDEEETTAEINGVTKETNLTYMNIKETVVSSDIELKEKKAKVEVKRTDNDVQYNQVSTTDQKLLSLKSSVSSNATSMDTKLSFKIKDELIDTMMKETVTNTIVTTQTKNNNLLSTLVETSNNTSTTANSLENDVSKIKTETTKNGRFEKVFFLENESSAAASTGSKDVLKLKETKKGSSTQEKAETKEKVVLKTKTYINHKRTAVKETKQAKKTESKNIPSSINSYVNKKKTTTKTSKESDRSKDGSKLPESKNGRNTDFKNEALKIKPTTSKEKPKSLKNNTLKTKNNSPATEIPLDKAASRKSAALNQKPSASKETLCERKSGSKADVTRTKKSGVSRSKNSLASTSKETTEYNNKNIFKMVDTKKSPPADWISREMDDLLKKSTIENQKPTTEVPKESLTATKDILSELDFFMDSDVSKSVLNEMSTTSLKGTTQPLKSNEVTIAINTINIKNEVLDAVMQDENVNISKVVDEQPIIEIDDDGDDDYDFMCSQMYIKSEPIEINNDQAKLTDDNYLQIKKELAEMDDYDELRLLPPIEIDSDGLSLTDIDLEKALEDTFSSPSEHEPVPVSVKENSIRVREVQMINALPQPTKRRLSTATAGGPSKKIKVTVKINERAASSREENVKIKEARKERLKKIVEKKTTELKAKTIPLKSQNAQSNAYVKMSAGRGNFLLQDTAVDPKEVIIRDKNKQMCVKSMLDKYGDIVETILDWQFKWFTEHSSDDFSKMPPITKKPIIKMCKTFSNFKDYYDVLQPLLMVNYWFSFRTEVQTNSYGDNNASDHFSAAACVRKKKPHSEMLCTTYITSENKAQQQYVRENNIVTITARLNKQSKEHKVLFGIVIWMKMEKIQSTDKIDPRSFRNKSLKPSIKLTFLVLVNVNEEIDKDLSIYCRYFPSFSMLLKQIKAIQSLKTSELLPYILHPQSRDFIMPSIPLRSLKYEMVPLNADQHRAVLEASHLMLDRRCGIYMINGPPGTGKSTMITSIVIEALLSSNFENKILLLAHSNYSIDSLLLRLVNVKAKLGRHRNLKLVRIGNRASVSVHRYTADELAEHNLRISLKKEYPQLENDYKVLQKEIEELRKSYTLKPTDDKNKQLSEKLKELKNFSKVYLQTRYDSRLDEERNRVLNYASVICSTLGSCTKIVHSNINFNFDVCIIDEATQAPEPDTLMPIYLGVKKLILVGDTNQLPAVTSSTYTKTFGYDVSLFSRIKSNIAKPSENHIITLRTQYRMNPEISKFPNRFFYENLLINDPMYKTKDDLKMLKPYQVFAQDLPHINNPYINVHEVDFIMNLVKAISDTIQFTERVSLGILTVYSKQRDIINQALANRKFAKQLNIMCCTVDSFQGQEKDIIIFSSVRNYPNKFGSDEQRLNVTLTRARHAFYIIGSKTLFEACSLMKKVKVDAEKRKSYYKVGASTSTDLQKMIKKR